MAKFYKVTLIKHEIEQLTEIIKKGKHKSQTYRNAYILLNVDEGEFVTNRVTNAQISEVLKVGMRTIDRVKKRFVEDGFEACLTRKPTSRVYDKKVDGDLEARMVSIACSEPPKGYAKWSLRMLADKMVELEYVDSISHETVRNVLKKRIKTVES
jgi:transposase